LKTGSLAVSWLGVIQINTANATSAEVAFVENLIVSSRKNIYALWSVLVNERNATGDGAR
jgi:hypothetical protein